MQFAPMLAVPLGNRKLRFPLWASPKLDGIRLSVTERGPITRGLNKLPNEKVRAYLDRTALRGLDGELIWGDPVAPDVVQRSISAGMARHGPAPDAGLTFFVFDSFTDPKLPFAKRYLTAERAVKRADVAGVVMVPQFAVDELAELARVEQRIVDMGFEGVVLRDPAAPYIFGRVDPKSQTLMKLKRRVEMTGDIVDVVERRGVVEAIMVAHPDWPAPFSIELHRQKGKLARGDLVGRRVRFSRHPGSWRNAPRSPLFVELGE